MSSTTPNSRMLISMEFFIDYICPWCFIAKRTVESVMDAFVKKHPEVEFEVTWRPFYLDPLFGSGEKVDKREFILKALGSQVEYDALMERIYDAASQEGIDINMNGNFGSMRNAHKLAALTLRRHGNVVQGRVVEQLFQDQFVNGKDMFEDDWLVKVGREVAGLDEQDIRLELADDEAGRRLDRDVSHCKDVKGIQAVPSVMVLDRFQVGGLQKREVYEDLFNKIFMSRIL